MVRFTSAVPCLTALAAVLVSPAALADLPLAQRPAAPVEVVGPAAKGDPKPFRAFDQAECEGIQCIADFGKKGNKIRTIKWISCAINTEGGVLLYAQATSADLSMPFAFIPAVSRGVSATGELASLEFGQSFEVPAGQSLTVQMVTSGMALASQCIISGTIE